jgi:nitrate reductase (NAD(P)H)
MIVPGYIGGRMIKWLASIRIMKHETYGHYHYHDNRILPPTETTYEQSIQEAYWYRSQYVFNELNIQSVIVQPNHKDMIPIPKDDISGTTFEVVGYCIYRWWTESDSVGSFIG